MSQALYRKWRSRTFADLVGQPHVVRTLQNALNSNRVAHAYLFNGPRGTGKTSTARLLAKALNCLCRDVPRPCGVCKTCLAIDEARYLDLIEIDAASNNGVEDIRELRNAVNFSPTEGGSKIYIVDEVHMLSPSAFNALLKTLEEPPSHVFFILATTEIHRIPATVISRCQRFDFRRIASREIQEHLAMIAVEEGCNVDEEAISVIAENAQGCMRDAISLLDQVVGLGRGEVTLIQVQELLGLTDMQAICSFVGAMVDRDKVKGLAVLQRVMVQGASISEFLQQVIMQLRAAFRFKVIGSEESKNEMGPEQAGFLAEWAAACSETRLLFALKSLVEAAAELKQAPHPQILVELALMSAINGPPIVAEPPFEGTAKSQVENLAKKPERSDSQEILVQAEHAVKTTGNLSHLQPSTQDEKDKADLRANWRNLQKIVKGRFGDNRADEALTSTGMANLDVLEGTVYIFLRDSMYRTALTREIRKVLRGKLRDYLDREVNLEIQVSQKAPSPQTSEARPTSSTSQDAVPEPQTQLDSFLREELGATPMLEVEQHGLLNMLEVTKGK